MSSQPSIHFYVRKTQEGSFVPRSKDFEVEVAAIRRALGGSARAAQLGPVALHSSVPLLMIRGSSQRQHQLQDVGSMINDIC